MRAGARSASATSSSPSPTGSPMPTGSFPPTSICWRGSRGSRRSTSCATERVLGIGLSRAAAQLVAGARGDRTRRRVERRRGRSCSSLRLMRRRRSRGGRYAIAKRSWSTIARQHQSGPPRRRAGAARAHRGRLQAAAAVSVSGRGGLRRGRHSVPDVRRAAARGRADRRPRSISCSTRWRPNFTRDALVALLRSPHFVFRHDEVERHARIGQRARSRARARRAISAISIGSRRWPTACDRCVRAPALHAALAAARELAPLADAAPGVGADARVCSTFWSAHLAAARATTIRSPSRERRARAAIVEHARRRSPRCTRRTTIRPGRSTSSARRAALDRRADVRRRRRAPAGGVHLLDDQAARYGDFDDVTIVGLIETEWPERPRRNIFYPPALLKALGWPSEKDRRAAADARFLDLLGVGRRVGRASRRSRSTTSARRRARCSSTRSRARGCRRSPATPSTTAASSSTKRCRSSRSTLDPLDGDAREWAELRVGRSPADAPDVPRRGRRRAPARAWSVSALETYLDCPFKFFAQHVLRLEEEPDDEEVMDPRRQGQFVHEVFEAFFSAWQARGHGAITPDNLDDARELFADVVDRALERAARGRGGPRADAAARIAGRGRARRGGASAWKPSGRSRVVERLLEHRLDGDVHDRDRRRAARRSRCAARPIGSICSTTARSG